MLQTRLLAQGYEAGQDGEQHKPISGTDLEKFKEILKVPCNDSFDTIISSHVHITILSCCTLYMTFCFMILSSYRASAGWTPHVSPIIGDDGRECLRFDSTLNGTKNWQGGASSPPCQFLVPCKEASESCLCATQCV